MTTVSKNSDNDEAVKSRVDETLKSAREDNDSPLVDPWQEQCVPAFPRGILPTIYQEFIDKEAAIKGLDASALAMMILGVAGVAIDHRVSVVMKPNNDWRERPAL
jgi:hypothetical protein